MIGVKVSSKFRWIWTSFARDSSFEVLFTGFSGWHRSDRSVAPVRPVQAVEFCDLNRIDSFASA